MSHRAWYIGIAGAVLLGIGLFALGFPVFLDTYDQWGWQIKCGTGYGGDLSQAAAAAGTDYPGQCQNALLIRRLWTLPLVVVGALALLAVLAAAAARPQHEQVTHSDGEPA